MAVKITAGNTDDRKPFDTMTAALEGRIVGDKGYISRHLPGTLEAGSAPHHRHSTQYEELSHATSA